MQQQIAIKPSIETTVKIAAEYLYKQSFLILSTNYSDSRRLTEFKDGRVQFVQEENVNGGWNIETNQLWHIRLDGFSVVYVNQKSQKCLKLNFLQNKQFGGLTTAAYSKTDLSIHWIFHIKHEGKSKSLLITNLAVNWRNYHYSLNDRKTWADQDRKIMIKLYFEALQVQKKYIHVIQKEIKILEKFCGKIIHKGCAEYLVATHQYASGSFPIENLSPYAVYFVENLSDVVHAIDCLNKINKEKEKQNKNEKVYAVGRSGGHHYTGKSSGGNDTIVIDLSHPYFCQIRQNQINSKLLNVGPGVQLKALSKELKKRGYSLPHGECPLVCVGGHAQTGGYGHLLRSFGLNGDYVEGFQIVTTDGQKVKIQNVVRPKSQHLPLPAGISQEDNDLIFTSVLTGNAGSFGIVTNYTYQVIRDDDHPFSKGFSKPRVYKKQIFHDTMKVVKTWSEKIKKGTDDIDYRGLDFMMSLMSTKIPEFLPQALRQPLIIIELVYSDLDKKDYKDQFKSLLDTYGQDMGFKDYFVEQIENFFKKDGMEKDEDKLSVIADSHVRRWPFITPTGREFDHPFRKRIQVTYQALTDKFIEQFVNIIDQVIYEDKMALGGGVYRSKGREMKSNNFVTYPHREATFNFVFDLFYIGEEGRVLAQNYQNRMQQIVDKYYAHGQERRLFWGTFGDTDMSKTEIVKMYYDNEEQYRTLQKAKKLIDPKDRFHTSLTVQLP